VVVALAAAAAIYTSANRDTQPEKRIAMRSSAIVSAITQGLAAVRAECR
jgi:hypothetical protein